MQLLNATVILLTLVIFISSVIFLYKKLASLQNGALEAKEMREKIENTTQQVNVALEKVTDRLTERLDKVTEQVSTRLSENVKAINESKSFLTERVENTEKTVRAVTNKLSSLQEVSEKMMLTNQEILNFQQMRRSKVRGGFGEILLENLLRDTIPADRFQMQYKFTSSGEVADAIIRLLDNQIVVIDAKFRSRILKSHRP